MKINKGFETYVEYVLDEYLKEDEEDKNRFFKMSLVYALSRIAHELTNIADALDDLRDSHSGY